MMKRVLRFANAWRLDEAGTTGFSVMWMALCVITAGLSVDISNGFRVKQQMAATADAAAHAGIIEIARGSN